jgi:predicted SAM-dependent methyltransferase
MKQGKPVTKQQRIKKLFTDNAKVMLDLGCGENKTPGSIGVDFRKVKGVDIVQNLSLYPWRNLPDECADTVITSHLLEHINPDPSNPQLEALIDLMLKKKLLSKGEIEATVGDYKFLGGFVRWMDECWRIMKPGGQLISVFPYAGSPGFYQDPTHLNNISHVTLAYFDPLAKDPRSGQFMGLYNIYRCKPWKQIKMGYDTNGFLEIALEKRLIDKSYGVILNSGMGAN